MRANMRAGLALAVVLLAASGVAEAAKFDLVIRSGRVLDGTGNPWFLADVGIRGSRITAIGDIPADQGRTVIDAAGLVVSPGFIDAHSHADLNFHADSTVRNYLLQGVTTLIGGNCGDSPYPLADFFAGLKRSGLGPNLAVLVGHNTIRHQVMGDEDRAPTEAELGRMEALVRQEMEAGAIGLSTGLAYVPGRYSTTAEIARLAKVTRPYRGIYATHMRNQGSRIREAIEEAIQVGREAGVPVQISHIRLAEKEVWGRRELVAEPIEAARREGLEVYTDQYPYTATSSGFDSSFPGWAVAGGLRRAHEGPREPAPGSRGVHREAAHLDARLRPAGTDLRGRESGPPRGPGQVRDGAVVKHGAGRALRGPQRN